MPKGSVEIKIMGREYKIGCPPEREIDLLRAADMLNDRMLELKKSGNIIGLERIAVLTALNLADDLLQSNTPTSSAPDHQQHIDRIHQALADSKDLLGDTVK